MRDIAGVILAGGRATRMGGGDKCLERVNGRPLVEHVMARLGPQVAEMALNANGDPARFAGLGLPVIADGAPAQAGPLAGILAGLDWAAGRGMTAVVTAAADTPFLPCDLAERLAEAARPSGLAIAASPDPSGELRCHPTFGLWPVDLREVLRRDLMRGVRKALRWAEAQGAGTAVFESRPFDPFFNINTPGDLAAAQELLSR